MDIAKFFGTDKQAEVEGVWVNLGAGARIKVARQGTPEFNRVMRRLRAPYSAIRPDKLDDEILNEIYSKALAEVILLGWEGVEENGKPLKFSKDAALRLLKEHRDFRNMVGEASASAETFKREAEETEAKNS